MPRPNMFNKDEVLDAALELVRSEGFEAVSARTLGKALGTTSRPIFSHFENMSELKLAIIAKANELYESYLQKEISSGKYPQYKASGIGYIRFAKEETELFKLLFMRDRSKESEENDSAELERIVDMITQNIDISRESAKLLHLEMWAYTHGIATMIATKYYKWNEELISASLSDVYEGLKYRFLSKK